MTESESAPPGLATSSTSSVSDSSGNNPSVSRTPCWRRWLRIGVVVILVLFVAGELTCRWWFGLGDPPLYMAHPEIEYLLQPSQTHYRFGNRVTTNAWSMRSNEFPRQKSDSNELRILVLGDSVANGGGFTDQSKLATEVLQQRLTQALKRPVVVGNASAGSWGPPNMLAYANAFGLFDADFVILILGSEDYGDAPTFTRLGADQPEHSPVLAIQEAVARYLPKLLAYRGVNEAPPFNPRPEDVAISLNALRDLIDMIQISGAKAAVALHAERTEVLNRNYKSGAQALASVSTSRQAAVIPLYEEFVKQMNQNIEPYRDWIHPNEHGQAAIAESLYQWIMSELK